MFGENIAKIQEKQCLINEKINDLRKKLDCIDTAIELITKGKEEKEKEIFTITEQIQTNLDSQLKAKLLCLLSHKNALSEEVGFLKSKLLSINENIKSMSKAELIEKSGKKIEEINEIIGKSKNEHDSIAVVPYFKSFLIPEYDSSNFEIKEYSKIRYKDEIIYSNNLLAGGIIWRLKVYPNGNGVAKGVYLSVFLEMQKSIEESSKYEYRIEMINQKDPLQRIAREYSSDFETGECWGYNKFYKIDLLEKEGFLIPESDTINLIFLVRPKTFAQKSEELSTYINQLEAGLANDSKAINSIEEAPPSKVESVVDT
jgi:tripartite motif-containing protein 37